MNLFTRTFSKIFKSSNQQELDKIQNIIEAINNKENENEVDLSDDILNKLELGNSNSKSNIKKFYKL